MRCFRCASRMGGQECVVTYVSECVCVEKRIQLILSALSLIVFKSLKEKLFHIFFGCWALKF